MNLDTIRSGFKCTACYQACDDGSYIKIHEEIKDSTGNMESHIFHNDKCEKLWNANQISNPTCPWCYPDNIVILKTDSQRFVEAAKYGNLIKVTEIMKKSLAENEFPISYQVAVFKAAAFGQHAIVEYLLSEGNISNDWCGHAVIEATKNKHPLVIKELYEGRIEPWENITNFYLEKSYKIAEEAAKKATYKDFEKYKAITKLIIEIQEDKKMTKIKT